MNENQFWHDDLITLFSSPNNIKTLKLIHHRAICIETLIKALEVSSTVTTLHVVKCLPVDMVELQAYVALISGVRTIRLVVDNV